MQSVTRFKHVLSRIFVTTTITMGLTLSAPVLAQDKPAEAGLRDATEAEEKPTKDNEQHPRIDVCFVLDTTGSMSNLIKGAKRKIWHIANGIVSEKPTPRVRFGLIGYRDRGDDYVTKRFDLTENIDAVYEDLQQFSADGGGDTPESVNQALHEAVTKMSWNKDRSVTKIIFLVGDAPPHMDYEDDVKYPKVCRKAVKRDLIINAVQCGNNKRTSKIWQKIARRAEGEYAAIGQSGDMQVVKTPHDEKLGKLNREIGDTMVPYGPAESRKEQMARQKRSEEADEDVAADRATYMAKKAEADASAPKRGKDLTELLAADNVSLDEIKTEWLPKKVQKMSEAERRAYLKKQVKRRNEIKEKIEKNQAKRRDYIERQQEKTEKKGGFDQKVLDWVRKQAK